MEEALLNKVISLSLIFLFLIGGVISCDKKSGAFYAASLGLGADRVLIASQIASVLTVSAYDLEGNFLGILADFQGEANGPRGLALYDSRSVVVSLEGNDRLDLLYLGGGVLDFVQSSFLTGTIGKIVRDPRTLDYFVIENTNMIERFSSNGHRVPVTGNPFVNGALAPCGAGASMRAMVINDSGDLIVVQSGTTAALRYTVGPTTASACATVAALPTNANDIINHSDGNLYWVGTNGQVYQASQMLTGSTSIFNNVATVALPTALAELPNGDLLIASDTTDSIEVISTSGVYRGTFRKDINTQQVHSILVVPGQ